MTPQIAVSPFAASREGILKLARAAAEAGLDGLALGDGFFSTPSFPIWSGGLDCFVELGWLAGQVDMARFGIEAVVLAARDPRVVAKQACTMSAITGGRFHLGVSAGFWAEDAHLFGYDFAERGARLDEGINALVAAWRGEAFPDGKFWSWNEGVTMSPCHAVQPPELWLAGGEGSMRRALRYRLPWQPSLMSPDEVAPLARRYFDGGGVGLKIRTRLSVSEPPPGSFSTLVGPADYLREQVHAYAESGADYVSVVPGYDENSAAATIEALALVKSVT